MRALVIGLSLMGALLVGLALVIVLITQNSPEMASTSVRPLPGAVETDVEVDADMREALSGDQDGVGMQVGEGDAMQDAMAEPRGDLAQLEAVAPFTGSGFATRDFHDSVFQHEVTAELGAPAPGTFYEGWLVNKKPTLQFFSTGKMNVQADGTYGLTFTGKAPYVGYDDVVITQETLADGLDGKPEAHVLEGTFE